MTECLGIYFENSIIKYAKLKVNNKNIELKEHGIRFVKLNKDAVILDIIEETNSKDIPIVFNSNNNSYVNFQIIENNSKKSYTRQILNTEFEAWCEKNAKSPERFEFSYLISKPKDRTFKCNGILNIVEKKNLEQIYKNGLYKVAGIYPANILVNNLVDENNLNYVLLNINEDIIVTAVVDGKIVETRNLGIGINEIIERFKEKLGSYQKAYEACRQINVYTEGESANDKELEAIAEPILQDVIKNISTFVTKYKVNIEKIYLTGMINLFRNLDILLKEYFDLKCEILIPKMIKKDEKDIAEIVEIIPAISIAYEHLIGDRSKNLLSNKSDKFSFNILKSDNVENRNVDILKVALGITTVLFVTYVSFGAIYSNRVNKIVADANSNIMEINSNINKINEDISYISENKEKYKKINTQVDEVIDALSDESGTSSGAYNVATFLQNIIRIIPEDVKLNSISSDDNKNIKIVAESDSYASLGYFVSELKLEGTLRNVTINDVKNGDITTIEIGGELP